MSSFVVEGGHRLSGTIRPQGAKNEALQIISAVLLTKEEVTISNVPEILDIKNLIMLLESSVQLGSVICNAIDKSDVVLFVHLSAHLRIDFQTDWTVKKIMMLL